MSGRLCEDWGCPAKVSCAKAFGRSKAYAEMRLPGPALYKGPREAGAESCPDYRWDKPREWLDGGLTFAAPGAAFGFAWFTPEQPR